MQIESTPAAVATIERARSVRSGVLSITIGTGCCESTAPFLYEDFFTGGDQEQIGDVAGVPVFAPEYLRRLYGEDESLLIDAVDVHAESLSIETEWGVRLILRGHGVDTGTEPAVCTVDLDDPDRPGAKVRGELPEALRGFRGIR